MGQNLVEWDPYSLTILTEVGGRVAYGDIIEGVSMKEEFDEVTGLSVKSSSSIGARLSVHASRSRMRAGRPPKLQRRQSWPGTCFRSGRISLSKKGPCTQAMCWPKSRGRRPRRKISRAVCLAWPSCSRPESRRRRGHQRDRWRSVVRWFCEGHAQGHGSIIRWAM